MTTWDKVLITSVLAAAVASVFLVPMALGGTGPVATVTVTVAGVLREQLPLNSDSLIKIETAGGYCRLEIKDGLAKVTEADCPKNLCVGQVAVSAEGGVIACLPHKIVVSAESSRGRADQVDAVVR